MSTGRHVRWALRATWFTLVAGLASTQPAADTPTLTPEHPLVGALRDDERHVYRLVVPPDAPAFVFVRAEEHGADVWLECTGAPGCATVNVPDSRHGLETLRVDTRQTSALLLGVRLSTPVRTPGRYTLSVVMPAPGGTGHALADALTLLDQWGRAYALDTPAGRAHALDVGRQALHAWTALGARAEVRHVRFGLAVLERETGQHARALETLALVLADAPDDAARARALNEIGFNRFALQDTGAARAAYEQALGLLADGADEHLRALVLNNLGLTHAAAEPRRARSLYTQALPLLQASGDRRVAALVTNNLAGVHQLLGEPDLAEPLFEQALVAQRASGDRQEQARVLANLGALLHETGRFQEALERYQEALVLARASGDARAEARLLNSLGLVLRGLGEPERALRHLHEALRLRRQTGDARGEAITRHNLGLVAQDAGAPIEAREHFEAALALSAAGADRRAEALSRQALGWVLARAGERTAARQALQAADATLEALGERRGRCETLRKLALVQAEDGGTAGARAALETALELCRSALDGAGETRVLLARAELLRREGQRTAALATLDEALGRIEALRAGVGSPELRASFLARQQDAYALAIELHLGYLAGPQAGAHARAALALVERGRARGLVDLLRSVGQAPSGQAEDALARRRAQLEARLDALGRRRAALGERSEVGERQALDAALAEAELALDTLAGELARATPRALDRASPRALDAEAIQALLDDDTLLLVYALGTHQSTLLAVTRTRIEAHALIAGAELEAATRATLAAWRQPDPGARDDDERLGAELSRLLLGPLAGQLGTRRLVIVPDGALHALPFAALPEPMPAATGAGARAPLLIERHEVSSLPSASVLALLRAPRARRTRADARVTIFADPVFSPDDARRARRPATPESDGDGEPRPGRLPGSAREAHAIARVLGPERVQLLLGFDATLEALVRAAPHSAVLHLATHARSDAAQVRLSALQLSAWQPDGTPRTGRVGLREVYALDVGADLVVLSACESALGRELRGEGLVGLARGFFHAGARRVLASLWRVPDGATAVLMERFYAALLLQGQGPAAALRSAQRGLLRTPRYRDRYFWAAFALQGDWRPTTATVSDSPAPAR